MTATYAQRKALGSFGERVACRHLVELGLEVLARNWRCSDGEVDILARDGHELVVCEVKTRSSPRFGTPLEAISAAKAARLHRLGRRWLAEATDRPLDVDRIRVDVVAISSQRRGAASVEHFVAVS